jgi:membrane protein YqaA with SNARE-associated domain
MKYYTAKFLAGFDIAMHLLGSVLGMIVGFVMGNLLGVLIASFLMQFRESYSETAKSKKEVHEYLFFKNQAKNIKKDKRNNHGKRNDGDKGE